MPTRFIEPFDFQTIYVNYFLGGSTFFGFALVILISFLSAYLGIPTKVYLILLVIGLVSFGAFTGQLLYTMVLFLVGFVLFKAFMNIIK
jgi:hypothetical protein